MKLVRVVAITLVGGLASCVTAPDESLARFDGDTLRLESTGGLLLADIELVGDRIIQGENVFAVALDPVDADALAGVTQASAFMPAHGHGTSLPVVSVEGDGFRVSELMLFMPGRWDVTFELDVAGAHDQLEFTVDVR